MMRTNQESNPLPLKSLEEAPPPSVAREVRERAPPPPPSSGRPTATGAGMSGPRPGLPLIKHRSWSPDSHRDEAWLRRQFLHRGRRLAGRSVTDEDLDELRGCIDLGFGFDAADGSPAGKRLSETLPALDLYHAVNRSYRDSLSRSSSSISSSSLMSSDGSPISSPLSIFAPDDNPDKVKARLKQWAQVVACSVRQCR